MHEWPKKRNISLGAREENIYQDPWSVSIWKIENAGDFFWILHSITSRCCWSVETTQSQPPHNGWWKFVTDFKIFPQSANLDCHYNPNGNTRLEICKAVKAVKATDFILCIYLSEIIYLISILIRIWESSKPQHIKVDPIKRFSTNLKYFSTERSIPGLLWSTDSDKTMSAFGLGLRTTKIFYCFLLFRRYCCFSSL